MNERKWLKLYVGWSDSDWLACLDAGPRLCWPLVLEYVKCMGSSGIVTVRAQRIATFYNVPLEWIELLLSAATADGAVQLDGQKLTVLNWSDYQGDPTGAERKRRHRESIKTRTQGNDSHALPPFHTVTERDGTHGTAGTTEKEKEKEKETETTRAKRAVAPSPEQVSLVLKGLGRRGWESDGIKCWRHWDALSWQASDGEPIKSWQTAVKWWNKDHAEPPPPPPLTKIDYDALERA